MDVRRHSAADEGPVMTLAWWLFVREQDSIRVDVTDPLALVVHGPRAAIDRYAFADEVQLTGFAERLDDSLRTEGWRLIGFNGDRRTHERRRVPRFGIGLVRRHDERVHGVS
jgi:hypothetical protein